MKCHHHPDANAVDCCGICGKEICAECRLDYDGRIVCKPCAMPLLNFLGPMVYCGWQEQATGNTTIIEHMDPAGQLASKIGRRIKKRKLMITPSDEIADIIEKLRQTGIFESGDGSGGAGRIAQITARCSVIFDDGRIAPVPNPMDALRVHVLTGRDITIASSCPLCSQAVTISIQNGRISSGDPAGAIALAGGGDADSLAGEGWGHMIAFFCSEDELYQWLWVNPGYENGTICGLAEALECAKAIFDSLPRDAPSVG